MRVLGFDPGIARLGFAVLDANPDLSLLEYGVIETSSKLATPARLRALHESSQELIAQFEPTVVAIEKLYFARNVTTAMIVGEARGVVTLAAAQRDLDIYEYSPTEVKKAVTGYGNAEKSQMQEMVRVVLGLDVVPHPDDAADAVATAICCVHSRTGYGALV